jgi:Domain of unknown function (DUF4287)
MPERVTGPAYYFPSIEKKYGQPIGYWISLIRASELTTHKALVDWLKAEYHIGHGHATALVGYALAGDAKDTPPPAPGDESALGSRAAAQVRNAPRSRWRASPGRSVPVRSA